MPQGLIATEHNLQAAIAAKMAETFGPAMLAQLTGAPGGARLSVNAKHLARLLKAEQEAKAAREALRACGLFLADYVDNCDTNAEADNCARLVREAQQKATR